MGDHIRKIDEQERFIARELIKNPRATDKSISELSSSPLRTVGRRRRRLEEEGILRYYAEVDLSEAGVGQNRSRHLYTIRFRSGVRLEDLRRRISQSGSMMAYNDVVYESYIAESDGRLAMVLMIEGENEELVVREVHDKVIPNMIANHGADSIVDISAMRLVECSRKLKNYLPAINMRNGSICQDWPRENIYVGR